MVELVTVGVPVLAALAIAAVAGLLVRRFVRAGEDPQGVAQ